VANKELETLFSQQTFDLPKWVGRGRIPSHYKRLTCSRKEADRLAEIVKASGGLYGRQKEAIEKYIEYSEIDLF